VLMACRNMQKGDAALAQVRAAGGDAELAALDLGSLASVREFAAARGSGRATGFRLRVGSLRNQLPDATALEMEITESAPPGLVAR